MMGIRQQPAEESYSTDRLYLYDNAWMSYPYTLPPLAYAYDALDPQIDEQTMHLHHDQHHQTYIDNANKTVEKYPELQTKSLVELMGRFDRLPAEIRKELRTDGGGHLNHTLFWECLAPQSGGEPQGKLAQTIKTTFDGFVQFKEQFSRAAISRSGSGWAWLCVTPGSNLEIDSTANQDTPLAKGSLPILALDVWEHAYYLKYHNKRSDYVTNWWQVVNWKKVEDQFEAITG
jgi:superoxide dismutase, Fe-Mn family